MNTRRPVIGRGAGRRFPVTGFLIAVACSALFPASSASAAEADVGPSAAPLDTQRSLLGLLAGNLQGIYTPVEGRPLAWSVTFPSAVNTVRTGRLAVTGADFVLRIALEWDITTGHLSWRVDEGRVDLGAWLSALATRADLASVLAGVDATGELMIAGEGTWHDDVTTGGLRMNVNDAIVRNETEGWSVEGITLHAGGDASELLKGHMPIELAVRAISTSRFGARNLRATVVMEDFERIELTSAQIEIAGGEVTAEPFSMSLAKPALSVTLVMKRVGLQDLVVFAPTTFSNASGRINGTLRLDWNQANGVQVGGGRLALEKSEPATVRLVSSPGFLTAQVPARFTLLPAWLGPLARWFSPVNPSYATLSEIEQGKLDLRVESLNVRLTPEGDERGRSASAFLRARPEQTGGAVGEVTFQINVSGPLSSVLRIGIKESFSLQVQ